MMNSYITKKKIFQTVSSENFSIIRCSTEKVTIFLISNFHESMNFQIKIVITYVYTKALSNLTSDKKHNKSLAEYNTSLVPCIFISL